MKTKNKFLLGALMTVTALGVVGSISGTYAWYSYNTKSPIAYHGIATGNSENLQVKLLGEDEWSQSISLTDFTQYSVTNGHAGTKLQPVSFETTQESTKALNQFKGVLSYGNPSYSNVVKDTDGKDFFLQTAIQLRAVNPGDETKLYAQNIYISDLTFKCTSEDKDISDAIRVHIAAGANNFLIAPGIGGTDKTGSLNLFGNLDLDNDGVNDTGVYDKNTGDFIRSTSYGFDLEDDEEIKDIVYGVNGVKEGYYTKTGAVSTFSNGKSLKEGITVGTTTTTSAPLTLIITIYLQGWAASCIDEDINGEFDLGMTFQCDVL